MWPKERCCYKLKYPEATRLFRCVRVKMVAIGVRVIISEWTKPKAQTVLQLLLTYGRSLSGGLRNLQERREAADCFLCMASPHSINASHMHAALAQTYVPVQSQRSSDATSACCFQRSGAMAQAEKNAAAYATHLSRTEEIISSVEVQY